MRNRVTPVKGFGRRLREARMATGRTQQWEADRIHIHRTTYNKYEAGTVEPTLKIAYDLAVLLNTSLDELLKQD